MSSSPVSHDTPYSSSTELSLNGKQHWGDSPFFHSPSQRSHVGRLSPGPTLDTWESMVFSAIVDQVRSRKPCLARAMKSLSCGKRSGLSEKQGSRNKRTAFRAPRNHVTPDIESLCRRGTVSPSQSPPPPTRPSLSTCLPPSLMTVLLVVTRFLGIRLLLLLLLRLLWTTVHMWCLGDDQWTMQSTHTLT